MEDMRDYVSIPHETEAWCSAEVINVSDSGEITVITEFGDTQTLKASEAVALNPPGKASRHQHPRLVSCTPGWIRTAVCLQHWPNPQTSCTCSI